MAFESLQQNFARVIVIGWRLDLCEQNGTSEVCCPLTPYILQLKNIANNNNRSNDKHNEHHDRDTIVKVTEL